MPPKEDREAMETIKNLRTGRGVYRRKNYTLTETIERNEE